MKVHINRLLLRQGMMPDLVARKTCRNLITARLILGSATPDISSYYRAINSNHLFEMLKRYNNARVAPVTVINMQEYW